MPKICQLWPHLGLLMMVKNEEKRILVTLKSILGFIDSIVIYDTGSTDDTVKIIQTFCEENKIKLHLKIGEFVDFSISRNVSLDFADTIKKIDFLLLLDCNDELRNGPELRKFIVKEKDTKNSAYLIHQVWFSGKEDSYYNTRLIKTRQNWRYKGVVHEYLANPASIPVIRAPQDLIIFQDRTKDNNKSGSRYNRDKVLLSEEHKKNPTEPRTLFYLAQTFSCLGHIKDSFECYQKRALLVGFWEEKFHAFLKCGELSQKLKKPWKESLNYYMKSLEIMVRAEPLVKIAQYYRDRKKWLLSFYFIQIACQLEYPKHCILFIDSGSYNYHRWHIMGIVAFYCQKYKEGKEACLKALQIKNPQNIDLSNLQFYIKQEEKEILPIGDYIYQ